MKGDASHTVRLTVREAGDNCIKVSRIYNRGCVRA